MRGIIVEIIEGENDLFEFSNKFKNLTKEQQEEILDQEVDYNAGTPNGRSPLHRRFSHYNFNAKSENCKRVSDGK